MSCATQKPQERIEDSGRAQSGKCWRSPATSRIYSKQNNYSAAESELRRALQIKPSQELHFELGLIEGQLATWPGQQPSFAKFCMGILVLLKHT